MISPGMLYNISKKHKIDNKKAKNLKNICMYDIFFVTLRNFFCFMRESEPN